MDEDDLLLALNEQKSSSFINQRNDREEFKTHAETLRISAKTEPRAAELTLQSIDFEKLRLTFKTDQNVITEEIHLLTES